MIYDTIHVISGLNNKLIPLLSLLRISRQLNKKIYCYWEINGVINDIDREDNHFLKLFEPINDIEFVDKNKFDQLSKNSKIMNPNKSDSDRNSIVYIKDTDKSLCFNRVVHCIHMKNDNVIGNYVPYPRRKISANTIINELRTIYKELIPKEHIMNKIQEYANKFKDKKIMGMHIRTTDTANRKTGQQLKDKLCGVRTGGFTAINYENAFDYIDKFLKNNKDWSIYISCDNEPVEKEILNKFSNERILYLDKPFGDDYSFKFDIYNGLFNSICEMYILSKCDTFVGTPGSSFSFSIWLLRDDKELDFWCDSPW